MKRVLRTGVILFAVAMLAVSVPALAKPVKVTAPSPWCTRAQRAIQ